MITEILLGVTIAWVGILTVATGLCIGLLWSDIKYRKTVLENMEAERFVLTEALKKINETHNGLMLLSDQNRKDIEDCLQKLHILMQGIPSPKNPFGGR